MTLYLENYFEGLQRLPSELFTSMKELRSLDDKVADNLRHADAEIRSYLRASKSLTKQQRQKKYAQINARVKGARELCDQKVDVASQTYEMVDKYIRKLDADLIRFEADIKRRLLGSKGLGQDDDDEDATPQKSEKKKRKRDEKKNKRAAADEHKQKKKRRTKDAEADTSTEGSVTPSGFGLGLEAANIANLSGAALLHQLAGSSPGDGHEMPVDPNEPTYCVCNSVSYGEMIGCDNPDCPIEWFHFACVGISAKPKGKWFCTSCRQAKKK